MIKMKYSQLNKNTNEVTYYTENTSEIKDRLLKFLYNTRFTDSKGIKVKKTSTLGLDTIKITTHFNIFIYDNVPSQWGGMLDIDRINEMINETEKEVK